MHQIQLGFLPAAAEERTALALPPWSVARRWARGEFDQTVVASPGEALREICDVGRGVRPCLVAHTDW
jgi:hypothetical protein